MDSLPDTHQALVLDAIGQPLRVETRPTPKITSGSAIIRVLAAGVLPYSRDIYNGKRYYEPPAPSVPGCAAIGRIVAVGTDATKLQPGNLVLADAVIRGRDDPTTAALSGISGGLSAASKRLMGTEWRDSTYAQYARVPLENCFVLDEKRLLGSPSDGGLGYDLDGLLYMAVQLVPYGGLRAVGVSAGDRVIISPATGSFGGTAVQIALAMGASVVAMGRKGEVLERLRSFFAPQYGEDRIQTVRMTNDVQEEVTALARSGPADVFFDISPPQATGSTHVKSAILSLGHSGRVCLMGGQTGDQAIPPQAVMHRNLTIRGQWMYGRQEVLHLIRMVESGALKLGRDAGSRTVGSFPLEQWQQAFDLAAERAGPGERVVLTP
ncbi:GroES-like protein [Aspergillus sclerotioniger CBS 115572]|uniref:GroES-like protein n=1 Tax=Aspergillus sclerotioniger CBS 115572 TaxID=1450535 RepID=A0A317UWU8_9EURO|nr:GroES-like protein [Aspergillus sclerotioniger CBS 115572]PWY66494.1 GroES-like protein [Aspergillus sclerotioniger CBS 115572]